MKACFVKPRYSTNISFNLTLLMCISVLCVLLHAQIEGGGAQGTLCGMDADFVAHVYELIHGESVRQQIEIVNKN